MSRDSSLLGELRGNLEPSTISTRPRGKVLNFAVGWPDPAVAVRLASHYLAVAYVHSRLAGYHRLVAEIGPWMMADRRRRKETTA